MTTQPPGSQSEAARALARLTYWPREIDDGRPDGEYVECYLLAGDLRKLATLRAALTPVTDDVKGDPPLYTMHTAELIADLDNTRLALRQREAEVLRLQAILTYIGSHDNHGFNGSARIQMDAMVSRARAALGEQT